MSNKCVVVLSGGQDSTTVLYWCIRAGYDIHTITFDYGQRHRAEIKAAERVAAWADVPHEIVRLGDGILKGTSPLVSNEELEQYESYETLPGGLEKTFVPMRNQLFLTIAANRAYVLGGNRIATGISQEDYGGYPDCRFGFIASFVEACVNGAFTGQDGAPDGFEVVTPLLRLDKKDTVLLASRMPGCYEALALTHTAYDGMYPPTGKDHASLLRAKGFEQAGMPDPLVLRAYMEYLMPLPNHPIYRNVRNLTKARIQDVIDWLNEREVKGVL